jgi:hypothetical protein
MKYLAMLVQEYLQPVRLHCIRCYAINLLSTMCWVLQTDSDPELSFFRADTQLQISTANHSRR